MHERALLESLAQLDYHRKRRDELTDKIRFSLAGLNGASLIALLSALGGSGQAASWLGFNSSNVVWSASAFTIGLLLAGSALFSQQNRTTREAGDASQRAAAINSLAALYSLPSTKENSDNLGSAMAAFHDAPLTGFQYSVAAIIAQNFSAGFWFIGIAVPIISVLRPAFCLVLAI